jgi:hypothetical protein
MASWVHPRIAGIPDWYVPTAQTRLVILSRSAAQAPALSEEIKANYEGFISYYGHYEFDAENGFVIQHVQGSLFPNREGQEQKRFVELKGDRLKLTTPPTLWGGGGEMVGVLLWEQIY